MLPPLLIGFIIIQASLADLASELRQDAKEFQRMQDNLEKLSEMQKKLIDVDLAKVLYDSVPKNQPLMMKFLAARPESVDMNKKNPEMNPYLFEGDIVLTPVQFRQIIKDVKDQIEVKNNNKTEESAEKSRTKRTVNSNIKLRWSFPIPYFINSQVNEKAVLNGIKEWEKQTCATFKRKENLTQINMLEFILGSGCYSYIGKVNKVPQQVSIGTGCTSLGTVTHEIGHALGFFHEQARFDRDDYVEILFQNIQDKYTGQFTKQGKKSMVDYGVGYDYGSVMHYDQAAFRKGKRITIETLERDYQHTIGQRQMPSFADVKRINFAYCNSSCTVYLDCQNGGYTDPKNCSICRCPDGLTGTLCTEVIISSPKCGVSNLTAENDLQSITANGSMTCYYLIKAPPTHAVYYEVNDFSFTKHTPCIDYLEIKYRENWVPGGARLCVAFPTNSMSEGNMLMVIFKGMSKTARFTLKYRIGIPIQYEGTTSETTTSTGTSSTITYVSGTSSSSTGTPSTVTTTSGITSTVLLSILTTSVQPSTTTGNASLPISSSSTLPTEPISTGTTSPGATPTSLAAASITTTTTTSISSTQASTTTTSASTKFTSASMPPTQESSTDYWYTDEIPISSKPRYPGLDLCSYWSPCSAPCGACGTTTRFCGGIRQIKACNLLPCANFGCCQPAINKRNLCVSTAPSDDPEYFNVNKPFDELYPEYYEDY